jgi:RNA polymerase sigma-70 factor (ECF subfamily)
VSEGDRLEFERFFRSAEPMLRRVAGLWTTDQHLAHDLVQETLVRAWERWPKVSAHPRPEAWCCTVLRNLATSRWRRARLERRHEAPAQATGPAAGEADAARLDVMAALRRLPPRQAEALVLHDVLGFTGDEIAAELRVPAGTVRSWLARARKAMAVELGEPHPPVVEGRKR